MVATTRIALHIPSIQVHRTVAMVMEQRQAGCSVSKQWVWVPIRLGSSKYENTSKVNRYFGNAIDNVAKPADYYTTIRETDVYYLIYKPK